MTKHTEIPRVTGENLLSLFYCAKINVNVYRWIYEIIGDRNSSHDEKALIGNIFFAPSVERIFTILLTRIPLWGNIAMSIFRSENACATSSGLESYFKNIKHLTGKVSREWFLFCDCYSRSILLGLKRIGRPSKFIQEHIPYLEGLMKKSIAQLKFPAPDNASNAAENSTDSIANDLGHDNSAEFENPEENRKNLNKDAPSQSVLTLQKSRPQSKRSKRSILNPQNVTVSMDIPIFSNGFTDAGLQTKHTCAFDCLFSTFACIYSDYSKYQAVVDANQSSELCTFIKKVMAQKKITRRDYVNQQK